jgi:predicted aconitase with swiveling domain
VFKVSNKKRIKVKVLCPGEFSAPALITRERISLLGNADPERGVFCDPKSELKGSSFAGWTFLLSASRQKGTHPAGIINTELDTLVVWGCVVNDIPLVQIKDQSIFEKVKNGDLVTLDPANEEIVIG